MDRDKIEQGFRLVMEGLGLDMSEPHLRDSPRRTAEAWTEELCAGLKEPPVAVQRYPLEEGQHAGMILLRDIPVKSVCAHHLLPFVGQASVGYIPEQSFCGLSDLSRVVAHFARRPQLQELLTDQVARALFEAIAPRGLGVVVQASHSCMELRGVNHSGLVTTRTLLGSFLTDPADRAEFLALTRPGAAG